jgi:hypothetical protein
VSFGDQPPADPARLERVLPITGQAAELWLIDQTRRGWRTRRRFPFGGRHQASTDPRSSGAGAGPAG